MNVSKNFILQEFVDSSTFKRLGESALWLIDQRIINAAQYLRDYFNKPLYINTWHLGNSQKQWEWRGFRPRTYNKCVPFSQHHFGRAIDFNVAGIAPQDVQAALIEIATPSNKKLQITAMEINTTGWTHIDCRNSSVPLKLIQVKIPSVSKAA